MVRILPCQRIFYFTYFVKLIAKPEKRDDEEMWGGGGGGGGGGVSTD